MAGRIEISPVLTKFIQAIASDANAQGAAQELTDILKKARVGELIQPKVKRDAYGVEVYVATNNGREIMANVPNANGKFETIKYEFQEFVKKYNKHLLPF